MENFDVIVIGKGPAGISAALYTQRANLKTAVISSGEGALSKAHKIDNYYGFPNGISGQTLIRNGEAQAEALGVTMLEGQVMGLLPMKEITVQTTIGDFSAKAVVLATGKAKLRPQGIEVSHFEGKGVSYCAVCDGFFYRGKNVCVLGDGDYAINEASELSHIANVTILTNGSSLSGQIPEGVVVDAREVKAIEGEERVTGVLFKNGERIDTSGVFIAIGTASAAALAKKTGIASDGDSVIVDAGMNTNIKGIFAAGDCTGGFLQVSKAVSDGAIAGRSAIDYIRIK